MYSMKNAAQEKRKTRWEVHVFFRWGPTLTNFSFSSIFLLSFALPLFSFIFLFKKKTEHISLRHIS